MSVEVVTVGDCPLTDRLRPIVAATREAVTSAAKHAGTPGTLTCTPRCQPKRSTCSFETAASASTRKRRNLTGRAFGAASSRGWPGTAARRRCGQRSVRAPKCVCDSPDRKTQGMVERTGAIKVVIVDDHAMFRAGVRSELGDTVDVRAEAADVDEAVAAVAEHRPDVVLLDVHLPGGGGVEVMRGPTS